MKTKTKKWHSRCGDTLLVKANKKQGLGYTGNVDVNIEELQAFAEEFPDGCVELDNCRGVRKVWPVAEVVKASRDGREWRFSKWRESPFVLISVTEL